VLVAQGMARIRAGHTRPGIRALFSVAGRNMQDATTADIGFSVAPRLNAAGRLKDMSIGINCLLATDANTATTLSNELSALNQQRRKLQENMQEQAEEMLDGLADTIGADVTAVCLYNPAWHQGVVGLIATRIKDLVNRPAIVFAPGENPGELKGSGRSVSGVHIRDVLASIDARHPDLLGKFGGHAMAAGLSLQLDDYPAFEQAFIAEVALYLDQIENTEYFWTDGELSPQDISLGMAETLRHAAPWGQGFPEPTFDGRFELVEQRIVGEHHLKLRVRPEGSSATISGIAFNHPEMLPDKQGQTLTLVYQLDVNEYRANRQHQLVVRHIECV
jgi:single-stranded-DNA-specific exonuclease